MSTGEAAGSRRMVQEIERRRVVLLSVCRCLKKGETYDYMDSKNKKNFRNPLPKPEKLESASFVQSPRGKEKGNQRTGLPGGWAGTLRPLHYECKGGAEASGNAHEEAHY